MNNSSVSYQSGSFRDPSGFVFEENNKLYRKINPSYVGVYNLLKEKGVFDLLQNKGWLINHKEITIDEHNFVIEPERIPFVSYPYEWSFEQLKDTALLTLKIQYELLKHDFVLKDASAFNIQFWGCKPIFIDTTSFEVYQEGLPWTAYKQFCEHFLAPLLLMKYTDAKIRQLWLLNIDGIPLVLASNLLPSSTYFSQLSSIHIHAHARSAKKAEKKNGQPFLVKTLSKNNLLKLIEHLYDGIASLTIKSSSHWNSYYQSCSYSETTLSEKLNFLKEHISTQSEGFLLDVGCNEGYFSKALSDRSIYTIAFDSDDDVINSMYVDLRKQQTSILPLVMDITNPTPSIGWKNTERESFLARIGTNNITLALALIHHLRIFHNIPLAEIVRFFASISQQLILEFVPKDDIQAQRLLQNKEDVYDDYTIENFEALISELFQIRAKKQLSQSKRVMYNLIRK